MMADPARMAPLAEEATVLLKALAHPARLMICCTLRGNELSVSELEEAVGVRQPRLSRELAKLRDAGLVETRREAKSIFYRLPDGSRPAAMLDAICAAMLGQPVPMKVTPASPKPVDGSGLFARIIAN